jgi:photoactive yellow protein
MSNDVITRFLDVGTKQAESKQNFVPAEIQEKVEGMSEDELNSLEYGVVKLDNEGKILFYNSYESKLSGIDPGEATGKNFFYDIAPCTNNRLFLGSFQKGVEEGAMKILFFYTFTYRMRPTNVRILYLKKSGSSANWFFIKKNF